MNGGGGEGGTGPNTGMSHLQCNRQPNCLPRCRRPATSRARGKRESERWMYIHPTYLMVRCPRCRTSRIEGGARGTGGWPEGWKRGGASRVGRANANLASSGSPRRQIRVVVWDVLSSSLPPVYQHGLPINPHPPSLPHGTAITSTASSNDEAEDGGGGEPIGRPPCPPHRLKSGRRCRPHTNNNQTSMGDKSLMTEQCAQPPACRCEWRAGRWAILPCLARLATPGAFPGGVSESHAHSHPMGRLARLGDWALVPWSLGTGTTGFPSFQLSAAGGQEQRSAEVHTLHTRCASNRCLHAPYHGTWKSLRNTMASAPRLRPRTRTPRSYLPTLLT